ncbi:MAG: gliding motility-associated ABC transporter ATP-binding subunit GldA [Chlorobi bacterium]|nr:gliding motility-associated ABC transporter ATP-binding subunit GldA [Chlorobiota bacterium]
MSVIVKNVTRYFGKQKALDDVSFSINSGEIVGFLGPNGAGKSTMMKIITGYLPASSGEVSVCNIPVRDYSLELRKRIGYLPEHNPLYLDMYVREYLEMVAGIYKISGIKQKVKEITDRTGLAPEAHKKIGALSKGYRQRVGLAQALIPDPDVLILDEPTTGLDPNQILEVRSLITEIGRDKTIMLSTHIMQEVEAICERVIIINNGKIVADEKAYNLSSLNAGSGITITVEFDVKPDLEKLKLLKGVFAVEETGENKLLITSEPGIDVRPDIFRFAVRNELVLLEIIQEEKDLESIFHDLTM